MGLFFGTDGFRGKFGFEISPEVATRCGSALAEYSKNNKAKNNQQIKILIGTDTRLSCDVLALSFACGALSGGVNVTYIGVCPTAGVSYLTKTNNYDFGIVISASHNPEEFNGIKIFSSSGQKIGDKIESEIEKNLLKNTCVSFDKVGKFKYDSKLVQKYKKFLKSVAYCSLDGLKIVLDCSNGASSKIAPSVFKDLSVDVYSICDKPNGKNINKKCGALHLEKIKNKVISQKADFGFAFDGDSDRLIAIDEKGSVVDGDKILYVFAKYYKQKGMLTNGMVVGTKHTNMGVEVALKKEGIALLRTDIGDKYVSDAIAKNNLAIGGEQSGHIFLRDKLETGDGVLNAIFLSCICKEQKMPLSKIADVPLFYQTNINVEVKNKTKIMCSNILTYEEKLAKNELDGKGRVLIRPSGTEPYIRIMVECEDKNLANLIAKRLTKIIKTLEMEL